MSDHETGLIAHAQSDGMTTSWWVALARQLATALKARLDAEVGEGKIKDKRGEAMTPETTTTRVGIAMACSVARAAKEASAKASPPPWPAEIWWGSEGGFAAIGPVHKPAQEDDNESPEDEHGRLAQADADFIQYARTTLPVLAGWVIRLAAEVERVSGDLDFWKQAARDRHRRGQGGDA